MQVGVIREVKKGYLEYISVNIVEGRINRNGAKIITKYDVRSRILIIWIHVIVLGSCDNISIVFNEKT